MITDEAISEFVSFTGASADEARHYLEMSGGDLQTGVDLFLEMGGGGGAGGGGPQRPAAPAPPPQAASPGGVIDADVAAEVAAAAAAAGVDVPMGDEGEEVRAPIASFQDQIINPDMERRRMQEAIGADKAAMERRMSFDPSQHESGGTGGPSRQDTEMGGAGTGPGGQAINQLFAAPAYNDPKPFFDAVQTAKAEGKWVLVNIQQAEVFASHQLNRDVWSDDTIQDIVTGSFIFWQRDDKSTEGVQFCTYYKCGHQLPNICVIDPRTGRRVKEWDGRKWVESHAAAEYLFGFLDEFSMSRSPPAGSPAASPTMQASSQPAGGSGPDFHLTGMDDAMAGATPTSGPSNADAAAAQTPAPAEAAVAPAAPQELPAEMPEEPSETAEHIKVSMRLPSGSRVTRRFLPSEDLRQLFSVASAHTEQPVSRIDVSMQFPKRSLRDVEGGLSASLRDAQVAGSMVVVTVRSA